MFNFKWIKMINSLVARSPGRAVRGYYTGGIIFSLRFV